MKLNYIELFFVVPTGNTAVGKLFYIKVKYGQYRNLFILKLLFNFHFTTGFIIYYSNIINISMTLIFIYCSL